jgi:hypothetical protein
MLAFIRSSKISADSFRISLKYCKNNNVIVDENINKNIRLSRYCLSNYLGSNNHTEKLACTI